MSSSKRRKKHRSSHNRPNDLFTANGDLLGELVETSIFDRALLVTLRGELQFPATLARRLRKNLINNSPGVFCWGGRGKCSKQTAKGLSELCTTGRLSSRSAAVRGSPDVQRRIWGGDAQWSAIARRRYPFNWIFCQRGSFADVSKNSKEVNYRIPGVLRLTSYHPSQRNCNYDGFARFGMYFQYHGMGEVLFHLAQVERSKSLMLFGNSTNRRTKSKLRHMLRHPVKTAVTKKISLAWFETFRETAARRRDSLPATNRIHQLWLAAASTKRFESLQVRNTRPERRYWLKPKRIWQQNIRNGTTHTMLCCLSVKPHASASARQ